MTTIVAPFIPGPPLIDRQFDKKFEEPEIITHYNVPFSEDSGSFTVGSHYSVGVNSNSNSPAKYQSPRQSRNIVHETSSAPSLQNNVYGRGLLKNFVPSPVDDVHLGTYKLVIHSSEIRALYSMKYSSDMLQNLLYFMHK